MKQPAGYDRSPSPRQAWRAISLLKVAHGPASQSANGALCGLTLLEKRGRLRGVHRPCFRRIQRQIELARATAEYALAFAVDDPVAAITRVRPVSRSIASQ